MFYKCKGVNKTYKIGGNIADCANISINFTNNIATSANMPHIMYDEECSIGNVLDKGTGSIIMVKTLLQYIKQLYPHLVEVAFDDMSSIECSTEEDIEKNKTRIRKKGTNLVPMPLYYLSIAYNGETWYEKHFKAVQQNTEKHIAYKERVFKLLNDPSEKPSDFVKYLQIVRAPPAIHKELEMYYLPTNTYSEFFHAIPKNDRCRLLRSWIKEFMDYYLRRVFSNFDWAIKLSNITNTVGGFKRKNNRKYYCPTGFVRNGKPLHYNSGLTINDL